MTELLDDAAPALERDLFFTNLESRYESLRDDPVAWSSIVHDRNIERGSIADRSPESRSEETSGSSTSDIPSVLIKPGRDRRWSCRVTG